LMKAAGLFDEGGMKKRAAPGVGVAPLIRLR